MGVQFRHSSAHEELREHRAQLLRCLHPVGVVCATQLLDRVTRLEGLRALVPVVVLVAQEAAVLRLAEAGGLSVVTALAGLDAGDQDVCSFLAAGRFGVARAALDAHVCVMAED